MNEKRVWKKFSDAWKFYAKRIELKNEVGMPDCHLVNGNKVDIFLELKNIERRFIDAALPIKQTQFIWFAEYKGKHAYMLFRVGEDYYLFAQNSVKHLRGKVKFNKFESIAILSSKNISDVSDYISRLE